MAEVSEHVQGVGCILVSSFQLRLTYRYVSQGLIHYSPFWSAYVKEFLLVSISNRISYIKVRVNFTSKWVFNLICFLFVSLSRGRFMYGPSGIENVPHREWVTTFIKITEEVIKDIKMQGWEDEFIGAKVCPFSKLF